MKLQLTLIKILIRVIFYSLDLFFFNYPCIDILLIFNIDYISVYVLIYLIILMNDITIYLNRISDLYIF